MHFRDRRCVRTLRPLFVYATARLLLEDGTLNPDPCKSGLETDRNHFFWFRP